MQSAEELRAHPPELFPDALEKNLIHKVEGTTLDCKIGAVDGGLLAQEFHGFDLVMARAVGVVFEYEKNKMRGHSYFPHAIPEPDIDALGALEGHEFAWHKGLFRLQKEISLARDMIEKFKPDYLLLDGSVVPQVSDKPGEDSEIRPMYDALISMYEKLYSSAEAHHCQLAGVIKDSRGKRFMEIISKTTAGSTPRNTTDTNFLSFLLQEGERTFSFQYSGAALEHQVLKDLKEWGVKVHAFYMKPVSEDRPLRVEFLNIKKGVDEIASTLFELSRINKRYAYPAILIEADMRAALNHIEIERAYRDLFIRTGARSSALKLRRDMRPFR